MDRLLFRVDGSEDIGMGHVFRTVTLAKEIKKIRPDIYIVFLTKKNKFVEDYLISNDFKTINIEDIFNSTGEITQIIDVAKKHNINKIIVDKFDIDTEYIKGLKKSDACIIQFFYHNPSNIISELGINPNLGFSNSLSNCPKRSKILIGSKYILVQEKFRNEKIEVNKNVENIFISFGAGDKNNITPKIIEFIDDYFKQKYSINPPILNIVIGPVYSNIDQIIEKVRKIKLKTNLIFNYTDLSSIMKQADLAIASVGGTIYELLSLKVPTFGILQSKDQEQVAKYLDKNNCIINLGYVENLNKNEFFSSFNKVFSKEERLKILKNASKLIDGKGAERCAKEILNLKRDI